MFDSHAHLGNSDIPSLLCSSEPAEYDKIIARGGSIGLLPQYLEPQSVRLFFKTLEDHKEIDIGEVGLDKRFDNTAEQIQFFKECLIFNQERKSLLSIHAVRSDGLLLKILKEYPQKRFIYHGFTGSYETAREIIKRGGIISLGLTSLKSKDLLKLLTLPFLLESDRAMGDEQEKVLKYVYDTVADTLSISMSELEDKVEQNWTICKA